MAVPIPDFGKFLESLRGSMSLREAAKRSGLSHAYIRDLELERNRSTNEKITPSPDTLKKLSTAYGYSYTQLMIKAGHLMEEDLPSSAVLSSGAHLENLTELLFIEIGQKEIVFYRESGTTTKSVDSLVDFSAFVEMMEEAGFKKADTDIYINFSKIKKYDPSKGDLYFDESGTGVKVTLSAIRQKKYHDVIMRQLSINNQSSLEYSFNDGAGLKKFGARIPTN